MIVQRLLLGLLLGVLVVQLVSVRVHIPVMHFAVGSIAKAVNSSVVARSSAIPTPVHYAAQTGSYSSVLFVGDVLLARNVEFLINKSGTNYPYQGLSFQKLASNPAVVGNFEASIPSQHIPTQAFEMTFSVAASYVPALARAGFTHLSLANNHTLDYAQSGFTNTVTTLQNNNLSTFGQPDELDISAVEFITLSDDKVVAVVAAYTLQQLPDYARLKEVFAYATPRSDLQIVYVHWGEEYVSTHNNRQREAAERFVTAGADVVIGHHPHVVQDIELVNGVPVFYSLGNYIFDQYDTTATQEGLMLHLHLSQEQPKISLVPVTSVNKLSQPHYLNPRQHTLFLRELAERSDKELYDSISSGYILLNKQVASSTKIAMINQ